MNFLDAYDITDSPTALPGDQPETSLNEEVSQVVGQLSRFWGGFRKQSQAVIETARKDLGEVVSQAQKELNKLTTEAPATGSTVSASESSTEAGPSIETQTDKVDDVSTSASTSTIEISKSPDDAESTPTPSQTDSEQPPAQPQTLLARLQASLPPQLVSSVQERLPESIKHASASSLSSISLSAPDFAQLRSTIATELQKVQGSSEVLLQRVQGSGGELLQRVQGSSEELLREASEFLKDAVRVVPPEEGTSSGVVWDGTDVWMIPTYSTAEGSSPRSSTSDKGKGKERRSMDSIRAATRAEALLTQLRHDPNVVRVDPAAEGRRDAEMYRAWFEKEVEQAGGIDADFWKERIEKERNDRPEVVSLFEILVPEDMDAATFWARYFFRMHQVEHEEERRKALLQGTIGNEEDFSWEDEEEDAPGPAPGVPAPLPAAFEPFCTQPAPTSTAASTSNAAVATPPASTPAHGSPRQSSEDSFDVVSSQVSRVGSVSVISEETAAEAKAQVGDEKKDEDEADSDWE
ncbi:uncharacterized protein LAESUDRAFT_666138 [Laetiporus sulphureus 93-53]|uniref:BSD domain-containing protein n=1 Tax=Laetiporus sulphureus 93-53 TaxID=1314785 RepID=A0A165B839_9APHY|nr:uncharacterized protein LAESUDRAFT_666138 [Laetiporus sulphureus 93-53]KZT00463.1 hypothetical protein LAESUDRAFT_666138 [Laetiporus sulphureus 93-53]